MNQPQTRPQQPQGRPAQQTEAPKRQFKLWYHPGPDDKAKTVWNGVTFMAGTPVTISLDNPRHYVAVDMPHQIDMPDGTYTTRTVHKKIFMGELAKGMPTFELEGHPRFIKKLIEGRKPQSSAEYRSWCQEWIAGAGDEDSEIQSARQLLERWDDEEAMRERCGVGDDDVLFLKPFFDMKASMLKKHMALMHAKGDGGAEMR